MACTIARESASAAALPIEFSDVTGVEFFPVAVADWERRHGLVGKGIYSEMGLVSTGTILTRLELP